MDGRWFDVGVSDPFLETFLLIQELKNRMNNSEEFKTFTRIVKGFGEIAVNGFHHLRSHDGIKSVQGVANQPQILARLW